MAKKKAKYASEFRKIYNKEMKGHPTYIYAEITRSVKNIKLDKNPNPKDISSSYIRPMTNAAKSKFFGRILKFWKFSNNDISKVEGVINSNKDIIIVKDKRKKLKKKGR
jgi:hypothetical protein